MLQRFAALGAAVLIFASGLPAFAGPLVSLTVLADDAYTVKSAFVQGETVRAYETGVDPQGDAVSFLWYDSNGALKQNTRIYSDEGWGDALALAADAPLGTWRVRLYSTWDGGYVLAEKTFTVAAGAPPTPVDGVCGPDRGTVLTSAPTNACSAGTIANLVTGNAGYAWDCAGTSGGTTQSCGAPRGYTITASAGMFGSVSPPSQVVAYGQPASVAITPLPGFMTGQVSTSCQGASTSTSQVVVPFVYGDCTVQAFFNFGQLPMPQFPQAISFNELPGVSLGDGTVMIAATASSGLPVYFFSATPDVCTLPKSMLKISFVIINNSAVTLVGPGLCSIVATQSGSLTWLPAKEVMQSFMVTNKLSTALSISTSMNPERYGRPLTITAKITGGNSATQGTVGFSVDYVAIPNCGNVAVINGEARCTTADLPAGVHSLVASYSGDKGDTGATSAFIKQYIKSYLQGTFRDLDADGTSDMVLRRPDGALIARLVGGNSVYQETQLLPAGTPWQVIHFGDINHDAKADIVLRDPNGEVAVWLMDGTRATVKYTAIAASEKLAFIGVADFDGDGRDEIIVRAADGKLAMRILGDLGVTATVALPESLTGLDIVRVADFDGDGRDDLLLADAQGSLSVELMRGAAPPVRLALVLPLGLDAQHLTHVGDFDGDGKMDLLFRDDAGHVISWLMGKDKPAAVQALPGTQWTVTHVGDFDGDGVHDLVLRSADGDVAVGLMDVGGAALSPARSYPVQGYKVAQVGDFNGDGVSDLMLEGPQHQLVIWIMNGNYIGAEAMAVGPSDWLVYP